MGSRTIRVSAGLALAVFLLTHIALADDAVGLVRVDAGTNGVVETEMPFSPIGDSGPLGYVSGAFLGDGGEFSDQLFRYDASTGETTNAVWSASAWLDPFTWLPSFMQAFSGDSLSLLRADSEPFSFCLFGRASGIAYRTGAPHFRSMAVDPAGEFADFSVFTRGLTTDLFLSDFATNHGDASSWFHVGRYPGHSILFDWRDAALPTSGGRVYLAADATRDSDGDGLPDEMERRVYGTSPYLADTDGDGVSDSLELAWGSDPLVAGAMPPMSLFSEPFEPPAVVAGPIDGQNGWTAGSRPASAVAQGEIVYEGSGALELNGGTAAHSVTCSAQVVWVDQRVHSECGVTEADIPQDVTAFFYFDVAGHPVMSDGGPLFTNLSYSVVGWRRWTRCTMMLDYSSRRWDMYVDGVIVGEGLSMRGNAAAFSSIEMSGSGVADNLLVTTERPLGLSSDGDELPDEWEIGHFGDLSHDGSADSDGDGMSDLVEFRAGTDPLAHNGDTDGDGLPDWWEAANGLNPLGSNDFARAAFRETFESPAVEPGDIAGQNGWRSSRSGAAEVQSRVVRSGNAALSIKGGQAEDNEDVQVSHSSASHADIVWMDIWQTASRGCDWCELPAETFAVIAFDGGGHPVLSDGDGFVTNLAVCVEDDARWVRCTCRYDFPNRKWDFYLDGILVSPGLSMRGTTASIHAFDLYGGAGCVDDIYVGIARPEGLSSDGDALPDEWEWRNLGSIGRDGTGDLDGDGLSDFDEYAAGTNPASADTDGDGLSDAWEIANGLDPLDASDAALDSDGDGYPNFVEYLHGCNPSIFDDFIPLGYEQGLEVAYYAFGSAITSMPDVTGLTPAAVCVWDIVDQASTSVAWSTAPAGLADRYAAVLEGAICVPAPGRYKITLESDDGSRLWIDGTLVLDHGTAHSMTSKSVAIPLSEGMHDMRIDYFENTGNAGLRLLWAKDGGANEVVPECCLFRHSNAEQLDSDGDGMPDWWEMKHGLDASDATDASLDPDGDGLSNLEEFLQGTDPHSSDSDGDSMPDWWEVANGTIPFLSDAIEDPDGDGLANIEEFLSGSTPMAIDTDGDGLTDYEERSQLGTDPTVADSISAGAAVTTTQSGRSFMFDVSSPQSFAVSAGLLHEWRDYAKNKRPKPASNRVVFRIDGHFVAYKDVPFDCSNIVYAVFYTPVLPVGEHEIAVEWCNPDFRARADLVALSVNEISGVDFEEVVRCRNSAPGETLSSRVSPAFVEGSSRFPWLVSAGAVAVRPCAAESWYADVPLSPDSATTVPICFEGLVSTNVTVAWEATDLFAETDPIVLRSGSSLLLAGCPAGAQGGTVAVFTNGAFACSYAAGASAALEFAAAGNWRVRAVWTPEGGAGETQESGNVVVKCIGGRFPALPPACQVGRARTWSCPGLSTNLFYDTDAYTHLTMSASGTATLLVGDTRGERLVAARIFEGGPVLDVAKGDPMWAVDSFGNVSYLAKSAEDHDRCRCYMRQYGASESVRFRIRSYTSSVLLDDYTTERWITPASFDRDGIAWFELVKTKSMAAACHTDVIYQGNVCIGEAVYGNGTLPEELR